MFILSIILVILSSYLLASSLQKNTKNNIGLIYTLLIAFAQIVFTFEILSIFSFISTSGVLICNIAFFIISTVTFFKSKARIYKPNLIEEYKEIKKALKRDKLLKILSIFFSLFFIFKLIEVLAFPVTFGDALGYYFPRCLSWIQNGNISHYVTPDTRELIMPVNMEFLYTWILIFTKSTQGASIFSYISCMGAIYIIYNLLGELGFCRKKRLWTVFVFPAFMIISAMSTTPCADLFIGSLLLTSIYLFYCFIKYENKSLLYFSTLAIALAIGTKTTAIIAFPSIFAIMFIFLWKNKKELFKKTLISFSILLFINFILFASYNYILNFIQFGNFISCQEQFLLNKFRGGVKGYLCNLIKYIICIFDLSGIRIEQYHDFMNAMQIKLFALLGETPASYTSPRFIGFFPFTYSNETASSALGAMGLLAFVPSFFLTFSKKLKSRKFLLLLLAISLIVNILVFSRVMVFTQFNIRYLVTFFVIASPIVIFSYIKSNKNIFKYIMLCFMIIYLFILPHHKPISYLISYINAQDKTKVINVIRTEKKIFEYFTNKKPTTIALMIYTPEIALSDIEELKLHGFKMDKILAENFDIYNLSKYEYIITNDYKIASSNVQTFGKKHCLYLDTNRETITNNNNKNIATVECLIPFEYLYQKGFKQVEDINLKDFIILKK